MRTYSRDFVTELSQLYDGRTFDWSPGLVVARGFADLGHEIFAIMPQGRLVSLLTGDTATVREEERKHFFPLYDADQLLELLARNGFEVLSLECDERRFWTGSLSHDQDRERREFDGQSLRQLLSRAYFSGTQEGWRRDSIQDDKRG